MKKLSLLLFMLTICLVVTIPAYAKRLKGCDYVYYKSPCWMPDSKHILYIKSVSHHKYRYGWLAAVSKSGDLWVGSDTYICKMNIETRKEEVIKKYFSKVDRIKSKYEYFVEENGKAKSFPYEMEFHKIDCSRDGKWICFNSGTLHLLSADGKTLKKLLVNSRSPKFSPDGKRILYQIYRRIVIPENPIQSRVQKISDLRLIDIDGTNDHLLVENAGHGIWHPGGEKIGFYIENTDGFFRTINVDGTDKKAVFETNCYPSDWAPSGKYINFLSTFLDMEGKRAKTEFKDVPTYGRFSSDGTKMVGGNLDISFSKVGDEKETVLLKNYSKEY
ncbi:MAG: hypothetical protein ABIK53_06915 [bacterium]